MSNAIIIREHGSAEVMHLEEIDVRSPLSGELLIKQTAIGVNFHDVYVRSGLYKTLALPGIPGCEATGVVEAIGPDVSGFEVGDVITYVTGPPYGAYSSHRLLSASSAVLIPDGMHAPTIAGNFLRGLTVNMLTRHVAHLEPGMTVLVHAAAGGVGRILCQVASKLGVNVIGTVGSAHKAELVTALGCDHPILYRETDFAEEVRQITQGNGVDVVFDSVGADTFSNSLTCLKIRGHLVNFGQSSGAVEPIHLSTLAEKSITLSRPILFHYIENVPQYQSMANDVFCKIADDTYLFDAPQTFALKDASSAHIKLESGMATKPLVLLT